MHNYTYVCNCILYNTTCIYTKQQLYSFVCYASLCTMLADNHNETINLEYRSHQLVMAHRKDSGQHKVDCCIKIMEI